MQPVLFILSHYKYFQFLCPQPHLFTQNESKFIPSVKQYPLLQFSDFCFCEIVKFNLQSLIYFHLILIKLFSHQQITINRVLFIKANIQFSTYLTHSITYSIGIFMIKLSQSQITKISQIKISNFKKRIIGKSQITLNMLSKQSEKIESDECQVELIYNNYNIIIKMSLYYPQKISKSLFHSSVQLYSLGQLQDGRQKRVQQTREFRIDGLLQNQVDEAQSSYEQSSQRSSQEEKQEQLIQTKLKLKIVYAEQEKLCQSLDNNYYNSSRAREYSLLIRDKGFEQQTVAPAKGKINFTEEASNQNLINTIMSDNLIQTLKGQVYLCSICKLVLQREDFEGSDCKQVNTKKFCLKCLVKKVETEIENNEVPKCFCLKNILPNSTLLSYLKISNQDQLINILKKQVPVKSQISSNSIWDSGDGQQREKKQNLLETGLAQAINKKDCKICLVKTNCQCQKGKEKEKIRDCSGGNRVLVNSQLQKQKEKEKQCPSCKLKRCQCIISSRQQNELIEKKQQKRHFQDRIRQCCCCSIF